MDDKQTLRLICAIALAAGGEKNVKTIMTKAKAMATELGEELDADDDDNSETDDDSDSEDDDNDTEDEDEDSDSDESEDEESEDDDSEDEDDEEKKPAKGKAKKPAAKKPAAKTPRKKKPQVYDRESDTHKEIFSTVLKGVSPNWKKDAKLKAKAKSASVKLEGADFLDAEGEVLASFKQSVKKHLGSK